MRGVCWEAHVTFARPDIRRGRDALLRDPAWHVQKTCNAGKTEDDYALGTKGEERGAIKQTKLYSPIRLSRSPIRRYADPSLPLADPPTRRSADPFLPLADPPTRRPADPSLPLADPPIRRFADPFLPLAPLVA
jgi:hypothetical protein